MKTPKLDEKIDRLALLEWSEEISEYGKEQLNEFIAIRKALNLDPVMRSAFKEAFEYWNGCRSDAEMGNWLYAKSKGITP